MPHRRRGVCGYANPFKNRYTIRLSLFTIVLLMLISCSSGPILTYECPTDSTACSPFVSVEAGADAEDPERGIHFWGSLTEPTTRRPVRTGEVAVVETGRTVETDRSGRFRIDSVAAHHTLRFAAERLRPLLRAAGPLYSQATGYEQTTITISPDLTPEEVVRGECKSLGDVTAADTPERLFPAARGCFDAGEIERALSLDWVALLLSEFDVRRTVDESAHATPASMRAQSYYGLSEVALIEAVHAESTETLPTLNVTVCAFLTSLGSPTYAPTYMTQRGIRAFQTQGRSGIVPNFDASTEWDALLKEAGCE